MLGALATKVSIIAACANPSGEHLLPVMKRLPKSVYSSVSTPQLTDLASASIAAQYQSP